MFTQYRLISWYLVREIATYFILSSGIFTFLFLMGKIFDLTRLIIVHHINLGVVLKLLFYTLPYFFSYIIPISALLSTLFTFMRLTQDKEYIALKAAGISPKSLSPILFFFACFCFFSTLLVTTLAIPWGSGAARDLIFSLVHQKTEISIKQGIFNDTIPGLIFYVDKIDNGKLKGIFIYDEREARQKIPLHQGQVTIANSGQIFHQEGKLIFNLHNGYICQTEKTKKGIENHLVAYKNYTFVFTLPSHLDKREKNPKEYLPWQLWQKIKICKKENKDPTPFILSFHRKISIPVGAFIFVFLGAALGLKEETSRHFGGITLSLICFIIYQAIFFAAKSLGETHAISPHLSLWIPNFIMAGITGYLWHEVING
ncbi:MAG: LptF/LptG family permease [Candidatus Desulfofervidaceae bacterium]|nr:LptF/LptG family permease [Candidatus Desulfofervidaceae bacterium]